MKQKLLAILSLAVITFSAGAVEIKKWNFNSGNDLDPLTGTRSPSVGAGLPAQTCGGVGDRFGNFTSSNSSDPDSDNTMWRIGSNLGGDSFPLATNANKTAGVQFPASTAGYGNIQVMWDQENSASSSKYWRIQYTTNGIDWLDHTPVVIATPNGPTGDPLSGTPVWQNMLTSDFSSVPGVANNPNFGFRLVSEFESTATGSGTNAYVANRPGSDYTTGGTLWIDMVTVSGDDLDPGNQPPTISAINDFSILNSNAIPPFSFTVSDAETPAADLTVSAVAADPSLVSAFSFGGSGTDRTMTITPNPTAVGTTAISVRVTDAGGKMSESMFYLTITQPLISTIAAQQMPTEAPYTIYFTVTNLPGDSASWVFAGQSSNTNVVQDSAIVFGSTATNRTATITAVTNAIGESTITITVTSEGRFATTNFNLKVLPPLAVAYSLTAVPNSPVPSVSPTTVVTGLTATVITRGPTLGAANLTRGFSANNWNGITNAVDPKPATRENALLGDYFQFAVTVEPNYTASLSTLDVSLRRSAVNAPMNYEWIYSFDNFATPGVTITNFTYLGRDSGTAPSTLTPYQWMTTDTAGQANGNPMRTLDLSGMSAFQNIPGGSTLSFRLLGWGNNATTNSNTVALGRDNGPAIRGVVTTASVTPIELEVTRSGNNVLISWPSSVNGTLQSASSLATSFSDMLDTPSENGGMKTITVPAGGSQQYFRLRQ